MSARKEFRELVDPAVAREAIEALDLGGGTESVPLAAARGRVLGERVDAALDVPGFDRATVDGYAVRAADTYGADEADPAELALVGTVNAGQAPGVAVGAGEAAEISTGAVIPDGADAVVMVERTDEADGAVRVRTALAPGDGIMVAGSDIAAGARALGPGTRLTAREVGLLAALGVESVPVRRRPRVGVISTGDELVPPGEPLDPGAGQIHDVNAPAVATAIEEAGGEAVRYPHVGDDYDAMEATLRRAADECDLVLSSGSTSASAVDVIYRVVEERGELLLHGVAVKPGKPMLVGRIDDLAYVGLPGYPVSALTIFRWFVAPAVRRAAGLPAPETATVAGEMASRERYAEGRLRLMPVGLVETGGGRTLVYPVDKGSGATTSLVEADGIVPVDADTEELGAGERVAVQLFSPDVRAPTVLLVGEDDPALSRLLDRLERPRFLPFGSREGRRRLRDGIPDVAVTAGPSAREVEAVDLGGWRRTWGLVVPAGNPAGVSGLADLVDAELTFVNRDRAAGLRAELDAAIDSLADERGVDRTELERAVDGVSRTVKAHESPARAVAAGRADVGLGLEAGAEALDLGFVPLGEQSVRLLANPERVEKPGVVALADALAALPEIYDGLAGYAAD